MFAVPSLVSLYLLASSPSVTGEKPALREEGRECLTITQSVFRFFNKNNPDALAKALPFSPISKVNNEVVVVTGRQWYWDYGTTLDLNSDGRGLKVFISSHIINTSDIFHLLRLDQWLYLFLGETYTFVITSGDVLHSFAIPTLGIKVDAVPGKDNTVVCSPLIPGLYFGNCSEICGVNHTVIPIGLVVDELTSMKPSFERFSADLHSAADCLAKRAFKLLRCVSLI